MEEDFEKELKKLEEYNFDNEGDEDYLAEQDLKFDPDSALKDEPEEEKSVESVLESEKFFGESKGQERDLWAKEEVRKDFQSDINMENKKSKKQKCVFCRGLCYYLKIVLPALGIAVGFVILIYGLNWIGLVGWINQDKLNSLTLLTVIILSGWLAWYLLKKRMQKFRRMLTSVFLSGVIFGLFVSILKLIRFREIWMFFNLAVEPIVTGLICLFVALVVGFFAGKKITIRNQKLIK